MTWRTLVALPSLVGHTILSGILAVVTSRFPKQNEGVCHFWSRGLLWACGASLHVTGLEHLDPEARYVLIANHQSLLDIPALWQTIRNPFRFVAKQELSRIPIFGAGMRAVGTVTLDRSNPTASMEALDRARQGIAQRCSLLFFAEGTRSPDGVLRRFKKGGVVTALKLGLPLVPIALAGTREILGKGGLVVHSGPIGVAIGAPIPVQGLEDTPQTRSELTERLEREVAALLPIAQKLRHDGRSP